MEASVRSSLDHHYAALLNIISENSDLVSDKEKELINRLTEARNEPPKLEVFCNQLNQHQNHNRRDHARQGHLRDFLSKDVHVKIARGITYPSDIAVVALHPIRGGVVVDRVPKEFLNRLGYTTDETHTLPTSKS
eukprot:TRINITY_DN2139_c0_g1_i3.p1 TRINITY_DN2139_c0_g1~~TRINITY_DN2139_c0_g1_i3.p1  ORF type:complete len:135 (+),score=20.69 TRINITY_DN2139_c0_g1_i3:168-572(+)